MTNHDALTRLETAGIVADLATAGIHIRALRCGPTIHLWPTGPVSTAQEVRALQRFLARSTYRIVWHRPDTRPADIRECLTVDALFTDRRP